MIVLDNVHGCFTLIRFPCFGDAVNRNGLLEDAVSAVFLIPQDMHNHVFAEAEILSGDLNFLRLQRFRNYLDRLTGEEYLVNPFYDSCLHRHRPELGRAGFFLPLCMLLSLWYAKYCRKRGKKLFIKANKEYRTNEAHYILSLFNA